MNDGLKATLKVLPNKPGVYIMRDNSDKVIYVGKAVVLKNRVRSYFRDSTKQSVKVKALVEKVCSVETIVTDNEIEALILECNLIKKYHPRYNIMLKDDKTYPYLKITFNEEYPRLCVTRRLSKDGAKYYGPYADVGSMHASVKLLRNMFPIRHCRKMNAERPCLQYHIKRCLAPCGGMVTKEEYLQMIKSIGMVLDGKTAELEKELKAQMQVKSEEYAFEEAARLRDQLQSLRRLNESQKAVIDGGDIDIIGYGADEFLACLQIFFVRAGKLIGRKEFFFQTEDNTEMDIITAFIKQYYSNDAFIPKEVLVTNLPEEKEVLTEWLSAKANHKVEILEPKRGNKVRLLQLANENAYKLLEERERKGKIQLDVELKAVEDLQKVLGLEQYLHRIDCFDISHTQGAETVASMVVFRDGATSKKDYRRYKLRTTEGKPDDFKSMEEVIYRRYRKYEDLPDLVIIDGGKGQLSSGLTVIRGLGLNELNVIGLAKREEEIFVEGSSESIILAKDSAPLHLIQRIRDEAHRFAITYHKKLRGKRNLVSVLDHIEGIGPKRRKALWEQFTTLDEMKAASVEELAEVKGMTKPLAEKLYHFFKADLLEKKSIIS